MEKLFGTDGIRGKANEYPMSVEMALRIGKAVAFLFRDKPDRGKIIIGKDSRISGGMLENAVAAGICSMGVDVCLTGVFPTPGVAHLTAVSDAVAGIMISASHNPFFDNGIKIFQKQGYKISNEDEARIESLVLGNKIDKLSTPKTQPGCSLIESDVSQRYTTFLKNGLPKDFRLHGMKLVIDCAHGATSYIALKIFRDLGATVTGISMSPNGKNINNRCGSEHPDSLIEKVKEEKADVGFAFDGDGDRLLVVDETGNPATGDQILAVHATVMKKMGVLKGNRVVSTVMSNLGLGVSLKGLGIEHVISDVGDRQVMSKMIETDTVLGGEDSGHMIFLDHHTTGDGIYAALKFIQAVQYESKSVSTLVGDISIFPQVLINVGIKNKFPIESLNSVKEIIESVESELGEQGRVLVRYSGTQPLCRVMVEGPTFEKTKLFCKRIAMAIQDTIGY